jgi:hypothetical protein
MLLCGGCGRGGCFSLLDSGVGAEGSEEVGEEGALGWHGVAVHEECLFVDLKGEEEGSRTGRRNLIGVHGEFGLQSGYAFRTRRIFGLTCVARSREDLEGYPGLLSRL